MIQNSLIALSFMLYGFNGDDNPTEAGELPTLAIEMADKQTMCIYKIGWIK